MNVHLVTVSSSPQALAPRVAIGIKFLMAVFMFLYILSLVLTRKPSHVLYFCFVSLILSAIGLWWENALLISSQAVANAAIFAVWVVDFTGGCILGAAPLGTIAYMFDRDINLLLRGLSLFHLWMPVVLFLAMRHFGYDRRALVLQTLIAWAVLLICFFFTNPAENINYITQFKGRWSPSLPRVPWLLFLMAFMPICMYLPAHWLFCRVYHRADAAFDPAPVPNSTANTQASSNAPNPNMSTQQVGM